MTYLLTTGLITASKMSPVVLLDLDDTIYPEQEYVLCGFEAVADFLEERESVNAESIFAFLLSDFENGVRGNAFDRLLQAFDLSTTVDRLVTVYREHRPDIEPFPDAKVFLKRSPNPVGILTDGRVVKQRRKIDALDIRHDVEAVYISGAYGAEYWKPSPRLFRRALADFDVPPSEALYAGDNLAKDFIAPNKLGMKSVHVHRDGGEYASAKPPSEMAKPDVRVGDLEDLLAIIPDIQEVPE